MQLNELKEILKEVNKSENDFDLFIESGSYVGDTIGNIKSLFKQIISIEITEKYYDYCKRKFVNNKNIEIIKGDSLLVLPELIDKYQDKKMLFFLDGHYSAGDTGKNDMDVPLIEELKIINEKYNNYVLIIVDDADLFDTHDIYLTWEGINEKNILNVINKRIINYFYVLDLRSTNKRRLIIELK